MNNRYSKKRMRAGLTAAISVLLMSPAIASEQEDILVIRNTTLNLIDALVKRGVLDRAGADAMIRDAQQKTVADIKADAKVDAQAEAAIAQQEKAEPRAGAAKGNTLHVTYIPEAVKKDLRAEVTAQLRDDVIKEVKEQAKQEQWGVPAALPDWVNRFSFNGELRLRAEGDFFGSDNDPFSYLDWSAINKAGGLTAAGSKAFINTADSRSRLRERLALGIDAKVADGLKAGIRLTTSNDKSPTSTNQTLGQSGQSYDIVVDRAFLRYDSIDRRGYDWFTLWGGRSENPWFSTDNVFDTDLSFEGFAGTFRYGFSSGQAGESTGGSSAASWGFTQPDSLYLTLGGFPLQEFAQTPHDKWLLGAQTGIDWGFADSSRLKFGFAYYRFINNAAAPNELGSRDNDYSAPQYFTKGNSVARISNDVDEDSSNPRLVGLAADFNVADVTASYDFARLAPIHLILTGDYSKNVGFDRADILRRTGTDIAPRTAAYQVRFDIGYPRTRRLNEWNIFFNYKYLERDAVLDAFTDSDFHLGGTDAKGWSIGGNYGIANNTWLTAKWTSTEAIDGPPFGIDILLLDLNAKF
jgi:putative porin